MSPFKHIAALLVLVSVCAPPAYGESPFELRPAREWILLGTGTGLGVTALAMMSRVDPLTLDDIAGLNIDDVNSFDRGAAKPYRETQAGDGMLYASYLLPFTLLARADAREDWRILGVMWVQTVLLQSSINGIVKAAVLRTRPYVYDPETPLDRKTSKSARLSFYSGHTGSAAANSFFVARVFHEYMTSNEARVLLWGGAALYPALTGFLRRDSGHHWRTDVLAGYAIGGLIGFAVPQLHLSYRGRDVSCEPLHPFGGTGVAVCVSIW